MAKTACNCFREDNSEHLTLIDEQSGGWHEPEPGRRIADINVVNQ
jgi:hypothetical protein